MRKNRFAAVLLAGVLSVSLILPASAKTSESQVVQVVNALGILVGDDRGDMHLNDPVTRAEFVTMAVKATPGGDQVGQAAVSPYPDVPRSHWASGYVKAAVDAGYVVGFSNGTFGPNRRISLGEGASIALKLLGYGPSDFVGGYPSGQMALYRSLKLNEGISLTAHTSQLTRRDAMYLFYNLLTADTKSGTPYLTTLGHKLNSAGEIDVVDLINSTMDGPIIAQGSSWTSAIPFNLAHGKVIRNGRSVPQNRIAPLDVLYYNTAMRTVWAYSDKVSGTIQSLTPNSANPTAVTVAGRSCAIETSEASYALSDLGTFHVGDSVTLLLGRSGGVAGVMAPDPSQQNKIGIVVSVDNESYADGKGGTYQARTAALLATDGQVYHYPCDHNVEAGQLFRATVSTGGEIVLRRLPSVSLTGKANSNGTRIGQRALAADVEILDVSGSAGLRISPQRLAGISFNSAMVRYYSLNGAGEIDRLILNDVTGDLAHYGVLTQMEGSNSLYRYAYNLEGTPYELPQSTVRHPADLGPIQVKGLPQAPDLITSLKRAGTGTVTGNQLLVRDQSYLLSDTVVVYQEKDGRYTQTTLAAVADGKQSLVGWYDKSQESGGRIRVLIAS